MGGSKGGGHSREYRGCACALRLHHARGNSARRTYDRDLNRRHEPRAGIEIKGRTVARPRTGIRVVAGAAGARAAGDSTKDSGRARPEGVTLDRKSTRLNSSHLVISYAVFCLKK